MASSTSLPTTFGTVDLARETISVTVLPRSTSVPAGGLLLRTRPFGWALSVFCFLTSRPYRSPSSRSLASSKE